VIRPRQLLPAVLLIALAVRVWGLGFGLPYVVARPDETEVAGPAVGFLSGDLRPPFFQWPTLFTYTVAASYAGYFFVTKPLTNYASLAAFAESRRQSIAPFLYISRSLSVVMGVLTVWWVFAICRRVFDDMVAIVAALFLSVAFLHVRDSHFGVTDVPMTAVVVLAVLMVLKWQARGTIQLAAAAGLVAGLAGSTKYNGLGVGVAFLIAAIERLATMPRTSMRTRLRGFIVHIIAFGCAMAVGFFGASPYILIDWSRFVADVTGVGAHLTAGHGMTLGQGWQYYGTTVLPAALGWPMFLMAMAGLILALKTHLRVAAVLFSFPIAYYAIAGHGYTVFARYAIPVIPFLCIAAAWFVVTTARAATHHLPLAVSGALITLAAVIVAAPTAVKTLRLDLLLTRTDNRAIVARTLADMLPAQSVVYQSGEHYGFAPLWMNGHDIARLSRYDEATQRFDPSDPEWILLQRSPLVLYSSVSPTIEALVKERYTLVRQFLTGAEHTDAIYDQQDAFYLPIGRLDEVTRPGPAFELYRRTR